MLTQASFRSNPMSRSTTHALHNTHSTYYIGLVVKFIILEFGKGICAQGLRAKFPSRDQVAKKVPIP